MKLLITEKIIYQPVRPLYKLLHLKLIFQIQIGLDGLHLRIAHLPPRHNIAQQFPHRAGGGRQPFVPFVFYQFVEHIAVSAPSLPHSFRRESGSLRGGLAFSWVDKDSASAANAERESRKNGKKGEMQCIALSNREIPKYPYLCTVFAAECRLVTRFLFSGGMHYK